MAGKGGGAWKVAYADFVTAMMAFFMVMWLVGQSDKVKQAIAEEFSTPPSARKKLRMHNRQRQLPIVPEKKLPSGQPAESPDEGKPRIAKGKFNPINMATLVFFEEESAELDQDARDRLLRLLPWIAGKPQKIEIRGHASRRPLPLDSRFADPWALCYARCRATVDFLIENGIPAERLRISQAAGYEPYTERVDPQWQARNSRVEIAMLSELAADLASPDRPEPATAPATDSAQH
jgi:chemotaxis protein MotB